ncbi:tol-pal system protein YbgF [Orrella sp. JC864]|uniref:tol-pal system protein YbgF n=1 Tax=Orrella sp. JC864 TaxID=3120298 RepID=UPI0012BC6643
MRFFPSRLSRSVLAAGAAACALAAPPAHAFSDDQARRAILELREQIKQITEQNQRARFQLADQIDALQLEVMRLRDQVEQASRPTPVSPSGQGPSGEEAAADPQEQAAYDGAIDLFRQGQYKEAAEALSAFTTLYPDSALVPTARFYLGSSRYALKDYKTAIADLQAMVQQAPDNARAPDALLVVAGSQIELNDRAGAKATLQRIVQNYPSSPAAETAGKRLQLL